MKNRKSKDFLKMNMKKVIIDDTQTVAELKQK